MRTRNLHTQAPVKSEKPSNEYIQMIEEAAEAIIESRNMCGNEVEALKQWEEDNGKLCQTDRDLAKRHADRLWDAERQTAGVRRPIGFEERKKINRILA